MTDLYSLLGVSKDASEDEIKKAYKKMAKKYHPDRYATKSESERKQAEEKFKEISIANDILTDKDKKAYYDSHGTMDGYGQAGGFDTSGFGFGDLGDIFGRMFGGFGGGWGGGQQRAPQYTPGQSKRIQVKLSLEDIYKGYNSTVKYKIDVRCKSCHGEGGTGVEVCPVCGGTGVVVETKREGFTLFQSQHACEHCKGTGKIVKNKCKHCGGSGFEEKEITVDVLFHPFTQEGNQRQYTGKGSESKFEKGPNGDLFVQAVYNYDQSRYKVQGNVIYELYKIDYFDAILGKEVTITLPDNFDVKVKIPRYSKDADQITVNNKYKLVLDIVMPTSISHKEIELLEQIRNIHK